MEEVTLDKVRNVPSYLPKMHLCVDVRVGSKACIENGEGSDLGTEYPSVIPPHGPVIQLEITVIIRDFFVTLVSAASATSTSMFLSTHIFMSHFFKQLLIELPGNKTPPKCKL